MRAAHAPAPPEPSFAALSAGVSTHQAERPPSRPKTARKSLKHSTLSTCAAREAGTKAALFVKAKQRKKFPRERTRVRAAERFRGANPGARARLPERVVREALHGGPRLAPRRPVLGRSEHLREWRSAELEVESPVRVRHNEERVAPVVHLVEDPRLPGGDAPAPGAGAQGCRPRAPRHRPPLRAQSSQATLVGAAGRAGRGMPR